MIIGYDDFAKVDVRIGTVLRARRIPRRASPRTSSRSTSARRSGRKKASAQVTELYTPDQLVGRQVAAVVNFPPKQIARMVSEVLVLGFPDAQGRVVLIGVDHPVPNGARMF